VGNAGLKRGECRWGVEKATDVSALTRSSIEVIDTIILKVDDEDID
jgi:hypothetical protein